MNVLFREIAVGGWFEFRGLRYMGVENAAIDVLEGDPPGLRGFVRITEPDS